MLGNFITRCLILILGYAYPGFECYKTVERNKVDFVELRFWCQYWIIVALFTVLEKFADVFIGWLPLYGEMKLALFIYLWYPKTKGTWYVYDNVLRPYASKHENDIHVKFQEWRTMAWDLAIFYWQICTELGQSATFQVMDFLTAQHTKFSSKTKKTKKKDKEGPNTLYLPSAPPWPEIRASIFESNQDKFKGKNKKWI
ncbi:unnamed protein product [Lupinus luteus]|uniref:HVA22-like protein n=1 Tax=Lupinus luteus TaxID=3873 RepID=A0AAV1WM78_LUPLU